MKLTAEQQEFAAESRRQLSRLEAADGWSHDATLGAKQHGPVGSVEAVTDPSNVDVAKPDADRV